MSHRQARPFDGKSHASSVGERVPEVSYVLPQDCPIWGKEGAFDGGSPRMGRREPATRPGQGVTMQGRLKEVRDSGPRGMG